MSLRAGSDPRPRLADPVGGGGDRRHAPAGCAARGCAPGRSTPSWPRRPPRRCRRMPGRLSVLGSTRALTSNRSPLRPRALWIGHFGVRNRLCGATSAVEPEKPVGRSAGTMASTTKQLTSYRCRRQSELASGRLQLRIQGAFSALGAQSPGNALRHRPRCHQPDRRGPRRQRPRLHGR